MDFKKPNKCLYWAYCLYVLVLTLIPGLLTVFMLRIRFIPLWVDVAFLILWVAVAVVALFVYFPLRCHFFRYGVDENGFTTIGGVYIRSKHTMPWNSIRHITIIAGPLERWLGFCFVSISAPGGWLFLEGIPREEAEEWSRKLLTLSTEKQEVEGQ